MVHLEPYVFADDAGKWQDRDVICLCAYLSDGEKWESFTSEWNTLLRGHGMMPHLHMAEFTHVAKKKGWDDTRALSVLQEFAAVVRKYTIIGFSVGLDAKHYRSLPKEQKAGITKPHIACLQRLLRKIRDRLHQEQYERRISFVLDEEEGSVKALYSDILALRRSHADLGKYIGAVCFADDNFYVPLQASDMLANLTYRWFGDIVSGNVSKTDALPEPLKSLLVDPRTGRSLDVENEFWTATDLDQGITDLLAANERPGVSR
jgi:hypothetical protein